MVYEACSAPCHVRNQIKFIAALALIDTYIS